MILSAPAGGATWRRIAAFGAAVSRRRAAHAARRTPDGVRHGAARARLPLAAVGRRRRHRRLHRRRRAPLGTGHRPAGRQRGGRRLDGRAGGGGGDGDGGDGGDGRRETGRSQHGRGRLRRRLHPHRHGTLKGRTGRRITRLLSILFFYFFSCNNQKNRISIQNTRKRNIYYNFVLCTSPARVGNWSVLMIAKSEYLFKQSSHNDLNVCRFLTANSRTIHWVVLRR